MRIPPQHHDGVGTDASLHRFLISPGHDSSPAADLDHQPRATHDLASRVRRLRDHRIAPPSVEIEIDEGHRVMRAILFVTAVSLLAWIGSGIIAAHLAGRI